MSVKAVAYLERHGVWLEMDGVHEVVLPLDKLQAFLDLITPLDVPPNRAQVLYLLQAKLVDRLRAQLPSHQNDAAAPEEP